MGITNYDGQLEAWVTQLDTMKTNLEALYGTVTTTTTLPAITNYDGMLEAMVEQTELLYQNFAKVCNAYHNVASEDYTINIPAGLMDWYGLKKVGGITILWNQIAESSLYRTDGGTASGITITHTTNGFTLTGTTTGTSNTWEIRGKFPASHVFALKGTPVQDGIKLRLYVNGAYSDITENLIFTSSSDSAEWTMIAVKPSATDIVVNLTWTPQLFDLTEMFGAGNEPSTWQEFESMFPADYEYNAGTLLSAGVTRIVSKDSDSNVIDTIVIPDEVQALTGYGWSCPNKTNYIDFDAKKYYQYVGSRAYDAADDGDSTVITDGTTTHYELDSAVETDISAYLTDTDINAVASGTVTFENQLGDNYKIPVPNEVEYISI